MAEGVVIKIDGDASGFQKAIADAPKAVEQALSGVAKGADSASQALDGVAKSGTNIFDSIGRGMGAGVDKLIDLAGKAELANEKLASLKVRVEESGAALSAAQAAAQTEAAALNELQSSATITAELLAEANAALKDTSNMGAWMQAKDDAREFEADLKKLDAEIAKQKTVVASADAAVRKFSDSYAKLNEQLAFAEIAATTANEKFETMAQSIASVADDSLGGFDDAASRTMRSAGSMSDVLKQLASGAFTEVSNSALSSVRGMDMFGRSSLVASAAARGLQSVIRGLISGGGSWIALAGAIGFAVYKLYDVVSGAAVAREAIEGMKQTAEEWEKTQAKTIYDTGNDPFARFSVNKSDFKRTIGDTENWLNDVKRVWSDGKKETKEIVKEYTDGFKAGTDDIRTAIEDREKTLSALGVKPTQAFADKANADKKQLDEWDKEVTALLKKKQNKMLTEAEQARLDEIVKQRIQLEIEYTKGDTTGYDEIMRDLEAEKRRLALIDAPVTADLYGDALKAAAQGQAEAMKTLNQSYGAQYAEISKIEDAVTRVLALRALDAQYTQDQATATEEYAKALAKIVPEAMQTEEAQIGETQLEQLNTYLNQYNKAVGDAARNDIIQQMGEAFEGMDEGAIASYVALLTQVKDLTSAGVDVESMFPGMAGQLRDFELLVDFLEQTKNADLDGIKSAFAEAIPQEVMRVMVDLGLAPEGQALKDWLDDTEKSINGNVTFTPINKSDVDSIDVTGNIYEATFAADAEIEEAQAKGQINSAYVVPGTNATGYVDASGRVIDATTGEEYSAVELDALGIVTEGKQSPSDYSLAELQALGYIVLAEPGDGYTPAELEALGIIKSGASDDAYTPAELEALGRFGSASAGAAYTAAELDAIAKFGSGTKDDEYTPPELDAIAKFTEGVPGDDYEDAELRALAKFATGKPGDEYTAAELDAIAKFADGMPGDSYTNAELDAIAKFISGKPDDLYADAELAAIAKFRSGIKGDEYQPALLDANAKFVEYTPAFDKTPEVPVTISATFGPGWQDKFALEWQQGKATVFGTDGNVLKFDPKLTKTFTGSEVLKGLDDATGTYTVQLVVEPVEYNPLIADKANANLSAPTGTFGWGASDIGLMEKAIELLKDINDEASGGQDPIRAANAFEDFMTYADLENLKVAIEQYKAQLDSGLAPSPEDTANMQTFLDMITEMQNSDFNGMPAFTELTGIVDDVFGQDWQGQTENMVSALQGLVDKAAAIGRDVSAGIADGAAAYDFIGPMAPIGPHVEAGARAALQSSSPSRLMIPVGQDVSAGIAEGMLEYDFSTATGTLTGAILAALDAVKSRARSSGENFGQGYVDGVLAKEAAAREAGARLGKAASAGLKAAQQEQSPAKVPRKSGVNFSLGYIGGIIDRVRDAQAAGQKLARASISGLNVGNLHTAAMMAASAGRTAAPALIDYDRLADALNERPIYTDMYVNDRNIAEATANANGTALSARSRRIAMGYGGY